MIWIIIGLIIWYAIGFYFGLRMWDDRDSGITVLGLIMSLWMGVMGLFVIVFYLDVIGKINLHMPLWMESKYIWKGKK
jgi:uncharacterized membrane protein